MKDRIWYWLFRKVVDHYSRFGSSCANRYTRKWKIGRTVFTLEQRDTAEPDGYERTELLRMLTRVRHHENRQNWAVPEPSVQEILKFKEWDW